MVSAGAFIGIVVTLVLTLLGPIVVPVVYSIRNKGKGIWKAWLLGAAGFIW